MAVPTIDGSLSDWPAGTRLDSPSTGVAGYAIYGLADEFDFYFAIVADENPTPVPFANTTIWLNTDLDNGTGYLVWGSAGAEYNIDIGSDGVARLYSGGPGETYVADVEYASSADGRTCEVRVTRSAIGHPYSLLVYVDVNDTDFIPNDYANVDFVVGSPPPIEAGGKLLDGDLGEWASDTRLDTAATGWQGYALHGDVQGGVYTFAIATNGTAIGAGSTLWFDTDLDRSTGNLIWGWAGGVEYNVNFGAGGTARLYSGGAGEAFVADIDYQLSADGPVLELALDASLIGAPEAVRVFADVNDTAFLPNDYALADFIIGSVPGIVVGSTTINGVIGSNEWTADEVLVEEGAYRLLGTVETGTAFDDQFVLAIDGSGIGAHSTIWLDTDRNSDTGYQIWGWAGGAEYNVNIAQDGSAGLYSGAAGETFVADLNARLAADGTGLEVAIPSIALAGNPASIRMLADVSDSVFLPGSYTGANLVLGEDPPPPDPVDDPRLRIGIVYSEITAENYFNITNYGQLFMLAQNQAMQAGIPFDLLSEADLLDTANLAVYDALVFPAFSHARANQVEQIALSLAAAAAQHGTGIVAAGNFLTNDETGAALPGDSYARMSSLLGVTLEGFGQTNGVRLEATGASHPIVSGYANGQLVGNYSNNSYLHFTDTSGSGEVLFEQIVSAVGGGTVRHDGVIATTTTSRNVHFATDALIGNNNILGEALDWVATDNAPDVSLLLTRGSSLFYSRNDMDQAMEAFDVIDQEPGIYDAMLAIVEDWYQTWGFVGSYYVDIGANPPDQRTDWSVSTPYYNQLLAMENEIGSHSFMHPHDTNALVGDTQQMLDVVWKVDPRNPTAVDPWTLTTAEQNLLFSSYRFQFETSRLIIERELGTDAVGAAVPGAPESVDTTREIIKYYDYLSGGYFGVGAGYPGAFGYLTPDETQKVYLAPNMSFDFSLIGFHGLNPQQAEAAWLEEYAETTGNATAPIIAFPWHDYGPTNWNIGDSVQYTREMFETVLEKAAYDGTEFVTGEDVAQRIDSFFESSVTASRSGNVITATVNSPDAGHFALDVSDEGSIASVAGWYAYNDHAMFLAADGGTFQITLGATPADVTRVSALPQRGDLISVFGNGTDLDFVFDGRGDVHVDLKTRGTEQIAVVGADSGGFRRQRHADPQLRRGRPARCLDRLPRSGRVRGTRHADICVKRNQSFPARSIQGCCQ